ncbi:hypothetical protein GGU11DRAFT_800394 [Lentinula aff. detonsa]|nr:hypothetical protein GGU11DRAFT_800394 [Lentinula aff. detonsa]
MVANASVSFPLISVAVFVGGTSGTGRAIADSEAFARHAKGNIHILIVGQNSLSNTSHPLRRHWPLRRYRH